MRQFLLLGASDWAFLITTSGAPDCAAERVTTHADDLARCADTARRVLDGGEATAEDLEHLSMLEARDDLFPELEEAVQAAQRVARGLAEPASP